MAEEYVELRSVHSVGTNESLESRNSLSISRSSSDSNTEINILDSLDLPHDFNSQDHQRHMSNFFAFGLIIAVQLGSGIFSSPHDILLHVGSLGASLIVWVAAGLLSWTGASCYAELGTTIPLNGGEQAYFLHIYGPLISFLYSFVSVLVLKPCSAAIVSIIGASYISKAISVDSAFFDKILGTILIFSIGFANVVNLGLAKAINNVLVLLKLLLILSIAIIGIFKLVSSGSENQWGDFWLGTSYDFDNWAMAIYAGLWAYDGWNNTNYVIAELKDYKSLPGIINLAMPTVITAYCSAVMSYFIVIPMDSMLDNISIASNFGLYSLGMLGSVSFSLFVGISCIGSLNANIFTAARLAQSAANEKYLPSQLSYLSHWNTPIYSVIFQCSLCFVYLLIGDFGPLVITYGISSFIFYFLAVLGVLILRRTQPDLERPYKTWTITPLFFCMISIFLLSRSIFSSPIIFFGVTLFMGSGIPIFYLRNRFCKDSYHAM